jgi:type II secretory pathway component GspD/PulD (secretin)
MNGSWVKKTENSASRRRRRGADARTDHRRNQGNEMKMNSRLIIGVAVLCALPLVSAAEDSPPAAAVASASRGASADMDIADLIARYSRRSGKQFIVDPRVRGPVPLVGLDPDRLSYDKLLAILNVNQFAAVSQGDWIVVVPDVNARQLPTPVHTDRNFKAAPDEIITLVLPVKNVCAAMIVPVLRPLMPQAAHMAGYPDINTLILSDHAANLRRIVTVIEALERAAPAGKGCEDWNVAKK